jgi:hypothetical protein
VSAEIVVQGFIDRIHEVNSLINSVVDDRFEAALQEAKDVDVFLASTKLTAEELKHQKPFLGVPFTTKDSTAVEGLFFLNISSLLPLPNYLAILVEPECFTFLILPTIRHDPDLVLSTSHLCSMFLQDSFSYDHPCLCAPLSGCYL